MTKAELKRKIEAELKPLLEAWLQQNVPGFKPGQPFKCINPAHQDKHPSMIFNGANASGIAAYTVHCFSCGWNGDIFAVIGAVQGLQAFPDQVRAVCQWAGKDPAEYLLSTGKGRKGKRRSSRTLKAGKGNGPARSAAPAERSAGELEAICEQIKQLEEGSAFTNLQLSLHKYAAMPLNPLCPQDRAPLYQEEAICFLAERRFQRPKWTVKHFFLSMYPAAGEQEEAWREKDSYMSLLIPLEHGHSAALISSTDDESTIGNPPPLFNEQAIEEARADGSNKLFITDSAADALTLEDRGLHCLAIFSRAGFQILWADLYETRWPRTGSAEAGILILWLQRSKLERDLREVLNTWKYSCKSFIELDRAMTGTDRSAQLKAGAFKYYLYC